MPYAKRPSPIFFNWRGIRERGREDSLAAPLPAVFPAHISFIEPSPQSERVEHTKNESNSEAFAKNNCLLVHENETNSRVVARDMGSGIKGLQEGGIRDHSLRIRDHGLGIGISAVFHRIRDQTDS